MENILKTAEMTPVPFPIPGATSDKLSAHILNTDLNFGPVFAVLILDAGARIPAHRHQATSEQIYVLEGDFINDGIAYGPGAFFSHDAGQIHGPHASKGGCQLIFTQAKAVDPTDFFIAE
ncbi:MAG: cupin domain-containing protein [Ferruginibacter sp.]|nr:cupin domain-containing protein [Cytophagales bacterium]